MNLSLHAFSISAECAAELSRLVGLTRLEFFCCSVAGMNYWAVPQIPVPPLPRLRELSIVGTCPDPTYVRSLTGLTHLRVLHPMPNIFAALPALSGTLLRLLLNRIPWITDACCAHIASLHQLTHLRCDIEGSRRLSDVGFAALRSGLTALRELDLNFEQHVTQTNVPFSGLEALLAAPSLRRIECHVVLRPGFMDDAWEDRIMALPALLIYQARYQANDDGDDDEPYTHDGNSFLRVNRSGMYSPSRWK